MASRVGRDTGLEKHRPRGTLQIARDVQFPTQDRHGAPTEKHAIAANTHSDSSAPRRHLQSHQFGPPEPLRPKGPQRTKGRTGDRILRNTAGGAEETGNEIHGRRPGGDDHATHRITGQSPKVRPKGPNRTLVDQFNEQVHAVRADPDRNCSECLRKVGRMRCLSDGQGGEVHLAKVTVGGHFERAAAGVEHDRLCGVGTPGLPERVGRGQRRMTAQIDLHRRREPSKAPPALVGINESRFGQVHLRRHPLHPSRSGRADQRTYRRGIAGKCLLGEGIHHVDGLFGLGHEETGPGSRVREGVPILDVLVQPPAFIPGCLAEAPQGIERKVWSPAPRRFRCSAARVCPRSALVASRCTGARARPPLLHSGDSKSKIAPRPRYPWNGVVPDSVSRYREATRSSTQNDRQQRRVSRTTSGSGIGSERDREAIILCHRAQRERSILPRASLRAQARSRGAAHAPQASHCSKRRHWKHPPGNPSPLTGAGLLLCCHRRNRGAIPSLSSHDRPRSPRFEHGPARIPLTMQ